MTTDRTEEGVRVRVKRTGEPGTALYGPYEKYGIAGTWPGFSLAGAGWMVPVRFDRDGWRGVRLFLPSELEPGPRRPMPKLGSRRVRHRDREGVGTLLETLTAGDVTWPGLDRAGNLMVPVELDNGQYRIWRATDIERAPEPEPVSAFEEPPPGPRVMVMGTWTSPKAGRVLYRMKGNRYPGFDEHGYWRVPVQVDDGPLIYPRADQLDPEPAEPKQASGPAPRLILSPREAEATILAEADKVANAIQAKNLRVLAGAAADALELFASRLRDIELGGDAA